MSWSPWPGRRNRFALRQNEYRDMAGKQLDAFLTHVDKMIHNESRIDIASGFLQRRHLDQARRVVLMTQETLRAEYAELNIVTAGEQITVAGADGDGIAEHDLIGPRERSWCQHVVALGDILAVEDADTHKLVMHSSAAADGVKSYLGAPVRVEGVPIGALCVYDSAPRRWTEPDAVRLEQLAELVSDTVPGSA
jgi:GAF domain-containing protein